MYDSVSKIVMDDIFLSIRDFPHPLYLKLESLNPAGSVKLKTALALLENAFLLGLVNKDTVFIESSSGNLGVALAMICAERGYRFTCVIDPNCSPQNEHSIRAYGANVVKVTEKDANGGYLGTRLAYIRARLAEGSQYFWLNQYENRANPEAHSRLTATAIDRHFDRLDYLFVGAGTTGTLMGCLDHFRRNRPDTKVVAVDSIGSITFDRPPSQRFIPGLGTSNRPPIFSPDKLFAAEMVPEAHTIMMCRHLTRTQGLFIGGSTGTVLSGVRAWRDRIARDAVVVSISPDWGDRYLDTVYNDDWVRARFPPSVLADDLSQMDSFDTLTLIPPSAGSSGWRVVPRDVEDITYKIAL